MQLTHFFIRRATTTTLMIAAIAGFGVLCYFSLPVSNLPEVEYPTIRVNAGLAGANPDVMASTVATPLESEFSMIPGIANMTSTSQTGQTNIVLQFDLNRSIDAAAQDVQAAIARAAGELPASMPSPPSYSKVNPAADPILWLEMSSTTMALDDFAKYADQVFAKRIAMVSGVSQVPVWGPSQPAIRVQVDPEKLAAYAARARCDVETFKARLKIAQSRSAEVPAAIEKLAEACRTHRVPMASHDDASCHERERYQDLGVAISEFPLNQDALFSALAMDNRVVMGAPNVLLGGSHRGGLSTTDAVRSGMCDILVSDYYYPALLHAPFKLAHDGACTLAEAWRMVSEQPAAALGLADRGRIATGSRADLLLVEPGQGGRVRLIATIAGGRLAYCAEPARMAMQRTYSMAA